MNWKKITIWVINILFYMTILAAVFGIGLAIFANEWIMDRQITIDSPKLVIDENLRYSPSDSIKITPLDEGAKMAQLEISHATIKYDLKTAFEMASFWELAYGTITVIIELLLYLYALWLLKAIVKSSNNPFIFPNVKRLRMLGLVLISGSILQKINSWYLSWSLKNSYDFTGLELEDGQNFDWTLLLAGLFIMIIAQVFNHGIRLREEQDLTI